MRRLVQHQAEIIGDLSIDDSQLGCVRRYVVGPNRFKRLPKNVRAQIVAHRIAAAGDDESLPTFLRWGRPPARHAEKRTYFNVFAEKS